MKIGDVGNPGSTTTGSSAGCGQADRLARLERDAVRDDAGVVELGDDAVGHVAGALAGAAGQQHHVGELERLAHMLAERGLSSSRTIPSLAARRRSRAPHRPAPVRSSRRPRRPHRLARGDDLVAGRENRDDRLAPDVDLEHADRRQHAGVAAGEQLTLTQHGLAGGDVGSRERHAAPGRDGTGDMRSVPDASACSTMTTASAPRGIMPPVAIGAASPGRIVVGHDAGVNLLVREPHGARRFLGRAKGVFGDHGEAVDVGAIERRNVDRRHDVGRQHAAQRRVQRNPFRRRAAPDRARARNRRSASSRSRT